MKKLLATAIAVCCLSFVGYSQKSKLKEAKNNCTKIPPDYVSARVAIDSAILDAVTGVMAETWYYRGIIYTAFHSDDALKSQCNRCLMTAHESFLKAEELDKKNEYLLELESKRIPLLRQEVFNQGVEEFQAGQFENALFSFEYVLKMTPDEVSALQNAAICAENAKDYSKAKVYYSSLIEKKNADNKTYANLAKVQLQLKDTAGALITLGEGRSLYPDSVGLILSEINIYLSLNRGMEALKSLDDAVKRDPSNVSLYLAIGSVNESEAKPVDKEGNALPAPKNQADLLAAAKSAYTKGLAIDPAHFELNFNMGALIFNEATELENAANAISNEAQYNAAKEKCKKIYLQSEPYLEKALAASPDDPGTLNSLKLLYFRTNETVKYEAIKKKLDALK